ncbi:MAG: hypothetical protein LBV17_04360 [Treponema sp.]|nr:hypothetical protein [Treponema sp.]
MRQPTRTEGSQLSNKSIDFIQPIVEVTIKEHDEVEVLSVYSGNGFIMGSYSPDRIGTMLIYSDTLYGDYLTSANEAVNTGREFQCGANLQHCPRGNI